MLSLGVALDKLRPNDVSNSIRHKRGSSHDGLLCSTSDITSSNCDDQADHRTKEPSKCIANNRGSGVISPVRLPNHNTPSNDWEAARNEHWNTRVGNNGGNVSTEGDKDDTDSTNRELEQDRIQGIVAEGGNNQGSKSRNSSVNGVTKKIRQYRSYR